MGKELLTNCDACGKEVMVVRERQDGKRYYLVHGLFCINVPAFFCGQECLNETMKQIKSFDYLGKDEKGRDVVDVDVMINESQLLDKMYEIVYEVDNPLFPTIVFQRILEVDPCNASILYGLASLYVGLLSAATISEELKAKLKERLEEATSDLRQLSPTGYEKVMQLREGHKV